MIMNLNDSCGSVSLYSKEAILNFKFRKAKHFLIITDVSEINNVLSLHKQDSFLLYKNELYFLSENKKLIFEGINGDNTNHKHISLASDGLFVYRSKKRKLELKFINDSVCTLVNTFYCSCLSEKYRVITQVCKYSQRDNLILLRNEESKYGDGTYIELPSQKCNDCPFLNQGQLKSSFYIGPKYVSDFEKYGLVPNLTKDTLLIINKNKIIYHKDLKNEASQNDHINFIFERE
jgi:hypothetical protein